MAGLQTYFEWLNGLSDADATWAFIGMGIAIGRRHRTGSLVTAASILDECRSLARNGKLKINVTKTAQLIERLHPFIGNAKQLADFARQVINKTPTWLRLHGDFPHLVGIGNPRATTPSRIKNSERAFQLYEAMLEPMRPSEHLADPDLKFLNFECDWTGRFGNEKQSHSQCDLRFHWPIRLDASSGASSQLLSEIKSLGHKDWVLPLVEFNQLPDGHIDVLLIDPRIPVMNIPDAIYKCTMAVVILPSDVYPEWWWTTELPWLLQSDQWPLAVVLIQHDDSAGLTGPSFLTRWVI